MQADQETSRATDAGSNSNKDISDHSLSAGDVIEAVAGVRVEPGVQPTHRSFAGFEANVIQLQKE
jgi:hypothetical protein